MSGSLVADLGISPEVWLILSLMGCVTLFFKFSRVWSVRNLDLILLFAVSPGLMMLVGAHDRQPWSAFALLFLGSGLWLVRCLVDLGLSRRPLLEPNLNMSGLVCLAIGILGLLLVETVSLPPNEGAARNPADPRPQVETPPPGALDAKATVNKVLENAPLPSTMRGYTADKVIGRILASLSHLVLVCSLIAVGWWHFDRPVTGLAMAVCYLLLPYTRIALVDSGQIFPSALILTAVAFHHRPGLAGLLIGLATGWMPACLGLVSLWAGFYRGRGALRFLTVGLLVAATCGALAVSSPELAHWARAIGARSLTQIGLLPGAEPPSTGSFWSGIDVNFRMPVVCAYLALVAVTSIWPLDKN
ncbi:MAG: hypothetical protein U0835_07855, partial [Isosphaeraceae bacterium]